MPWSWDIVSLLLVMVVLFFAGFGWAWGVWLAGRIQQALFNRPPAPPAR